MSYLMRIADIEKEINGLSAREVFNRVKEILRVKESPTLRFSDRGVGYVDPLDIISSTRGGEIISDYANEAKKEGSLENRQKSHK